MIHRPTVVMLALSACGEGTAPAPEPAPGVVVAYPSGGTTLSGLAARNLIGDGRLDLITVSRGDGTVRVLPGRAAGAFGPAAAFTAGDDPIEAAAGDLNGDGIADLVVVGHLANSLSVRLGGDAGRFAPPTTYPLRNHGNRLVVTDLNGDGFDDVVVSHDGSGAPIYVTAFLGSADGTLRQVSEQGTDYFTTEALVAGDFDGDGRTDLAVAMGDNRAALLVFRGLGTGAFARPVALPTVSTDPGISDGTTGLAVGDLNGDGLDDIVVACFGLTDQLVVRLSTGDGFAEAVRIPLPSPVSVALGDVNGDGRLDAVASLLDAGRVSLLYGRGDGSFDNPVDIAVGPEPVSVALADFDGDGLADLAVTDIADHAVRVVLNPQGQPDDAQPVHLVQTLTTSVLPPRTTW